MQHIIIQNSQIWFDDSLIKENDIPHCFDVDFWKKQNAIVGSAKGRGTTWFVQTGRVVGALRHYWRGGVISKLIRDRYLFLGWQQTRSAKEFALLKYLAENAIPVPRPIAARATKARFCYQADLLVEKIENADNLVDLLKNASMTTKDYYQIGQLVRKLHDLGVCHSDLNISNILRDHSGIFWLIDFDKCARRRGQYWKAKNLQRLLRSFKKEQVRNQILWNQDKDWQALLVGYN